MTIPSISSGKTWHLAETDCEIQIAECELQLWRVFYGFLRWQEACEKIANRTDLTGNELAILHIIRMKERPKSINDIMRLLNRDDSFNIQYSIRKLLKKELIKKVISSTTKKAYAYEITENGIKNTEQYKTVRKALLIEMIASDKSLNLEDLAKTLSKVKGIYDEADRAVASYIAPQEQTDQKKNP